jgi:hypothetical protein
MLRLTAHPTRSSKLDEAVAGAVNQRKRPRDDFGRRVAGPRCPRGAAAARERRSCGLPVGIGHVKSHPTLPTE